MADLFEHNLPIYDDWESDESDDEEYLLLTTEQFNHTLNVWFNYPGRHTYDDVMHTIEVLTTLNGFTCATHPQLDTLYKMAELRAQEELGIVIPKPDSL